MRLMLIVVTVAVAMLLDLRVSQATQMPWCAGTSKGDFFSYNCSLPTYEMCVQEVIAGNRGFAVRTRTTAGPNSFRPRPSGSDSIFDPCKLSTWGRSPRLGKPKEEIAKESRVLTSKKAAGGVPSCLFSFSRLHCRFALIATSRREIHAKLSDLKKLERFWQRLFDPR